MLRSLARPIYQHQCTTTRSGVVSRSFSSTRTTMAPLKSWLAIPADSDFSLSNLPFGIIYSKHSADRRPAVAIGTHAFDLRAFAASNGFSQLASLSKEQVEVFSQPTLNAFAALGRPTHRDVRKYLQDLLAEDTKYGSLLKDDEELRRKVLIPNHEFKNVLPLQIGDYTDFFAGVNHAFNVGTMFRGPANALQPNYTHLPVGYHGRASSVVVSGTPIRRPNGQTLPPPSSSDDPKAPSFGPCRRLDIELELGCFLCKSNPMGEPVPISKADENIFGYVLMNDWSARDIQTWEYVPLGPFNAKNFGTSISAWVVLADALEPFRAPKLQNETEVLPYLKESRADTVFDIKLEVDLTTPDGATTTISKVSGANLLWSFPQMLTHHSVGGCPMNTGDLLGSGTISGKSDKGGDLGSLLEMNQGGKKEIMLAGMDVRTFLKDGDVVTLRGACEKDGERVGFGVCEGMIEKAIQL